MSGALSAALFVSAEPVPRSVRLPDGSVHVLHFRQLPAAEFRRYFGARDKDDDAQSLAMARMIAASLCTADGQPAMTAEQAATLTAAAERAISDCILEVNGLTQREDAALGKALPSGASSGSGTS
jgi:hypothetical protein